MATGYGGGYATGYGHTSGYGGGFRVQQPRHGCAYRVAGRFPAVPLAAEAEEAILTVGILPPDAGGAARSIRPVTRLLPR